MDYYVVDVFSDRAFLGNPVAVVFGTQGLTESAMQGIAAWFNLSETSFVTDVDPARGAYSVRIFTPGGELPFAGHPTLGTAAAVKKHVDYAGAAMTQRCGAGDIAIRFDAADDSVHLVAPAARLRRLTATELEALDRCLGMSAEIVGAASVEVGPVWITVLLDSAAAIENYRPPLEAIARFSEQRRATGIVVGAVEKDGAIVKVRTFAPSVGVPEDPVCGSGNVALALLRRQLGFDGDGYAARQGQEIGRDGRIRIRYLGATDIELGGNTHLTATGRLETVDG